MSADIEYNIPGTSNFVYHSASQEELSYRRVGCLTKLTSRAHFVTPRGVVCCVCMVCDRRGTSCSAMPAVATKQVEQVSTLQLLSAAAGTQGSH